MSRRTTTVALILFALVFTGVGVWFANRAEQANSTEEMVPEGRPAETTAATKKPAALSDAPAATSQRESVDVPKAAPPPDSAPKSEGEKTTTARHVHGRVLDLQGAPVPGLDVFASEAKSKPYARSSSDGSFDFDASAGNLVLLADSSAYTTIRALVVGDADIPDGLVVVAPVVRLSGSVVDERGIGVEGAQIVTVLDDAAMSGFPFRLDATMPNELPETKSGAGGAFTLERSVASVNVKLRASHAEFDDAELAAPVVPASDVRFVLKSKKAAERWITGVVVRADGSAATKARVHLGEAETGVDERGAFRFTAPEWVYESQKLVAVEAGSQAAFVPEFGKLLNTTRDDPAPVRLVLGPAPLVIAGHVVDEKHAPLAGWIVGLLHPTSISVGRVPPVTAEGLTVGEDKRFETDAKGAFRIEGLTDREYDLFAYDPESLARIETKPFAAGTLDVEIVVKNDVFVENVTGHVVAADGTPITGVDVSIGMVTARDEGATSWVNGTRTRTDGTGAFAIAKMPRKFAHLDVDGEIVLPKTFPLEDVDLGQPLRLEVERRCHLRIEGLPPSETTRWLGAYDAGGKSLALMKFQSGGWSSTDLQQITTDSTRAYAVAESAVELRLFDKDNHLMEKRALHLVPGEVTVVKW